MKHQTLQLFATILIVGYASLSSASDKSATVFPAEGNQQCSDYAANSTVIQMGTTSPLPSGSLTGAENPRDADSTGEAVLYSVEGQKVVSFSQSTTPIDYAILKSNRNVSVIIYPSGGVLDDANMRLTVDGVDQPITAISLCYGLGNQAPLPPVTELKTLRSCGLSTILDKTGVSCPTTGERTLVCNFELDKSFFGLADNTDTCCVCNSAALVECDPKQPAGGPNSCLADTATATKEGAEVPVIMELNNDPYYVSCVSGICTYYRY